MKVLHFTNKPIYPVIDGGCVAMKNTRDLLEINKSEIEYTHFTLATHKHPFDAENYPTKKGIINYFKFINTKIKPLKLLFNLFAHTPYNVQRFYNTDAAEVLEDILTEHEVELVILESIYLLPYLKHLKGVKTIVRTHNVEGKLWRDRAESEGNFLIKRYAKHLAKQIKHYEEIELQKVNGVLTISKSDEKYFSKFLRKTITISPSLNTSNTNTDYALTDFYFLGAFDWAPNKEGVDWLLKEVIPNKTHNFKIHIAGKNLDKNLYQEYDFVENHGEIEDADDFIAQHGIALIPLLTGGGVKMKILESFKHGKPSITTVEGHRGLSIKNNKEALIAQNSSDFFDAMLEAHNKLELRKQLGKAAKEFLNDNFAPDNEAQKLIEFIKNI